MSIVECNQLEFPEEQVDYYKYSTLIYCGTLNRIGTWIFSNIYLRFPKRFLIT